MDTHTFNVLLYQPPRSWFQSFHQILEHGRRDRLPFTQKHQWGPTLSLGDHIWLSVGVPVLPKGVGSGCWGQGSVHAGQVLPNQSGKTFWACLCAQGGIVLLKQEMAFRKLLPHFLSMEAGKTAADHYSSSAKLLLTFWPHFKTPHPQKCDYFSCHVHLRMQFCILLTSVGGYTKTTTYS